jgi:hypothetical protein
MDSLRHEGEGRSSVCRASVRFHPHDTGGGVSDGRVGPETKRPRRQRSADAVDLAAVIAAGWAVVAEAGAEDDGPCGGREPIIQQRSDADELRPIIVIQSAGELPR